jgi:hypothetical protein
MPNEFDNSESIDWYSNAVGNPGLGINASTPILTGNDLDIDLDSSPFQTFCRPASGPWTTFATSFDELDRSFYGSQTQDQPVSGRLASEGYRWDNSMTSDADLARYLQHS